MCRIIFLALFMATMLCCAHNLYAAANPQKQITPCIYINGNVHNPGHYDWHKGMTVADAIKAANGFTHSTTHRITILHSDFSQVVFKWNASANTLDKTPVLKEGDTLFVSDLKRII